MKEKLSRNNKVIIIVFFNVLVSSFAFGQNWLPLQEGLDGPIHNFFLLEDSDQLLLTGIFDSAVNGIDCNGAVIWEDNSFFSPFEETYWSAAFFPANYDSQVAFWGPTPLGIKDTIYLWEDNVLSPEFAIQSQTIQGLIEFNEKLILACNGTLSNEATLYIWNGLQLDSVSLTSFLEDNTNQTGALFHDMEIYQGELYMAGNIQSTFNPEYKEIISWDGEEFHGLNNGISGLSAFTMDLEVFNNELYIAGLFWQNDGNPTNNIMKWNGSEYLPVGDIGANSRVDCLVSYGGYLYATGFFTEMDGILCRIARWDGQVWEAFNNDVFQNGPVDDSWIQEMIVYQDTLYIEGVFEDINGVYFNRLARYNGALPTNPNVSIKEEINNFNIEIYPNPTNDQLHLDFGAIINEGMIVKIQNSIGEIIKEITIPAGEQNYIIDTSLLSQGVYFVKVQFGKSIQTKKIIIQ